MPFVYVHVVVFAGWMLFVEESPWPNRASAFQQEKADHDFIEQETELKTNTELTREIHKLTTELHRRVIGQNDRRLWPRGCRPDPEGPGRRAVYPRGGWGDKAGCLSRRRYW